MPVITPNEAQAMAKEKDAEYIKSHTVDVNKLLEDRFNPKAWRLFASKDNAFAVNNLYIRVADDEHPNTNIYNWQEIILALQEAGWDAKRDYYKGLKEWDNFIDVSLPIVKCKTGGFWATLLEWLKT